MALDEKDKAGTSAEYDLRGDDRTGPEGYGKPRRRRPMLGFLVVVVLMCVALGLFLQSRKGDVGDVPRGLRPGEAVPSR